MSKAHIDEHALAGRKSYALVGAVLVLLLGTWLRFHRIETQSLWYDEGNTAYMTLRAPGDIVRASAADIHPPGYYLAVTGWSRVAGRSEFALRAFSAFAGIGLLGFIYRIGQGASRAFGGLLAAFLGSVHPALVYYSQEARMYMLASMLGAILVFTVGKLLGSRAILRDRKLGCSYIMVAAGGLYIHYTFAFVLMAINLAVLWRIWRSSMINSGPAIWNWFGLQLGTLILYAAWLPTAFRHLTSWPAVRTQNPVFAAATEMWHWLAIGPTIEATEAVVGAVAIGLLVVVGVIRGRDAVAVLWLVIPAALMLSFGLFGEAFAKFLVLGVPAVALLGAGGAVSLLRVRHVVMRIIVGILIGVGLWFTGRALVYLYGNPDYYRDDYRGIVAELHGGSRASNAILLNAPNQMEVLSYYDSDLVHVFPVARTRPFNSDQQRAELAQIARDYDRLTMLFWGEEQADPDMVVERWLDEHTYNVGTEWYGDVRLVRYSVLERPVERLDGGGARFGEAIELRDYSFGNQSYSPGDVLQVALTWLPLQSIERGYKVFVHLYSQLDAAPVAQHDGVPVGGSMDTATWRVGREVVDRHGVQLPDDISVGDYTLAVGLYAVDSGIRLSVTGDNEHDDRLLLGTISVSN